MEGANIALIFYIFVFFDTAANQLIDDNNVLAKLIELYNHYPDSEYQHKSVVVVIESRNRVENTFLRYVSERGDSKISVINMVGGCNATGRIQRDRSVEVGYIRFIIMFMTPSSLENILDCLKNSYVWKPLARILLVFDGNPERSTIVEIFRLIWKRKLLNFSVLAGTGKSTQFYGFNPFFNNFYEKLTTDIFYDKLKDLNRYKLSLLLGRDNDFTKVWMIKFGNRTVYRGKDGQMISSILKHINADFQVTIVDEYIGIELNPWRTMNFGAYEHLKGQIIRNTSADLLFDSRDVIENDFTDNLYPHAKDDYVIALTKREISQQKYVLQLFEQGVTYFLSLLLLVCPMISYISRIITNKIRLRCKDGSILDDIFRSIELLAGISTSRLPKCPAETIFFLFILLSCLIVNNYFQSMLKSVLTVSETESEIHTIKKLAESGIKVKCPKNLVEQIKMFFQGTPQMSLVPNFEHFRREELMPNGRSNTNEINGLCVNLDRVELILMIRPNMYVVKESLIPNYVSIHVVKDSPYKDVLEKNIRKIIESGLYDMWKIQTTHQISLMSGARRFDTKKFKSFNLYQIRFAFYFIFIGLFISIITFLIEIISKFLLITSN